MRIAVSGTSCQGKTTLIKDFIKEWPMYSTPEKTYRDFINENNLPYSDNTNKEAQWSILNHIIDTIMESETILMLTKLWPMFVAFILLIVTLAQSHYRIKVLEEKVKVVFELINKINERKK